MGETHVKITDMSHDTLLSPHLAKYCSGVLDEMLNTRANVDTDADATLKYVLILVLVLTVF